MRILITLAWLTTAMWAQPTTAPSLRWVTANPSGACSASYITINRTTGVMRACVASTWTTVGGGGMTNLPISVDGVAIDAATAVDFLTSAMIRPTVVFNGATATLSFTTEGWSRSGTTLTTTDNVEIPTLVAGKAVSAESLQSAPVTYEVLEVTDNSLARVVSSRPNAEVKRIVILGSSVAAGVGASVYANSWAGLFTVAMAARGWAVINVSISGHSTQFAINRFWTDVAPLKPDVIVHATGFQNDSKDFTTYTSNMLRLLRMTEQIGAIPVVIGQYANSTFDATSFQAAKDVGTWLESMDVATWDWMGVTANSATGAWLTGYDSGDTLHPSDAGHAAMFNAIPLNLFDRLFVRRPAQKLSRTASWKWDAADVTNVPLTTTLNTAQSSWTVAAWIKDGGVGARGFIGLFDASNTHVGRVRSPSGNYTYLSSGDSQEISSAVSATGTAWHHIAVTYLAATHTVTLYIDGVSIGTIQPASAHVIKKVYWLAGADASSNVNNGILFQPIVYRTVLTAAQVSALAKGTTPRAGVEWTSLLGIPCTTLVSDVGSTSVSTAYQASWAQIADYPTIW